LTVFNLFSLLGGIAFFLYGMQLLGSSLEQRAGSKLKPILESLTNSNLKGIVVGAVVTGLIQSSTATTVMLVGFVNSGIMQLHQAISVIFGANIGTTITSWLLSLSGIESDNFWVSMLKPSSFAPLMAFIGIIIMFSSKRKKDVASIFIGFSILMFGMEAMSGSVAGLAEVPGFVDILTLFTNPLFGVLAGAVITAAIQSSAASVGILQALANTGTISYAVAMPIVMGQNIGTCLTALISSIGANKNAKRVALAHLYFNSIGTLIFLIIYFAANALIDLQFMNGTISAFGVAVFHSIFNITCTIIMFPLINVLEKLVIKTIPDDGKDAKADLLLDERLLATPSIAIDQCRKITCDMAELTKETLLKSIEIMDNYNDKEATKIIEIEEQVDLYEDKIGAYLVKISSKSLSDQDTRETSKLLHSIGDFERISDHAINIVESAQEKSDKDMQFSEEAQKELGIMVSAVTEIMDLAINCFVNNDALLAMQVEPLEQVIDGINAEIRNRHIQRLQNGLCTIELGFVLSDFLTNLERVSDHCSNIAISVIEAAQEEELNRHQYVQDVKSGQLGEAFSNKYSEYLEKFDLSK